MAVYQSHVSAPDYSAPAVIDWGAALERGTNLANTRMDNRMKAEEMAMRRQMLPLEIEAKTTAIALDAEQLQMAQYEREVMRPAEQAREERKLNFETGDLAVALQNAQIEQARLAGEASQLDIDNEQMKLARMNAAKAAYLKSEADPDVTRIKEIFSSAGSDANALAEGNGIYQRISQKYGAIAAAAPPESELAQSWKNLQTLHSQQITITNPDGRQMVVTIGDAMKAADRLKVDEAAPDLFAGADAVKFESKVTTLQDALGVDRPAAINAVSLQQTLAKLQITAGQTLAANGVNRATAAMSRLSSMSPAELVAIATPRATATKRPTTFWDNPAGTDANVQHAYEVAGEIKTSFGSIFSDPGFRQNASKEDQDAILRISTELEGLQSKLDPQIMDFDDDQKALKAPVELVQAVSSFNTAGQQSASDAQWMQANAQLVRQYAGYIASRLPPGFADRHPTISIPNIVVSGSDRVQAEVIREVGRVIQQQNFGQGTADAGRMPAPP